MKKIITFLMMTTLTSSTFLPLYADNSLIQEKSGAFSFSENIYNQDFLKKPGFEKLTPKQQKAKKISYYEANNIKPLRNRLIAWTTASAAWMISALSISFLAQKNDLIEETRDKIKDFPNPFPYIKKRKVLKKEIKDFKSKQLLNNDNQGYSNPLNDTMSNLFNSNPLHTLLSNALTPQNRNLELDRLESKLTRVNWRIREKSLGLFGGIIVTGIIIAALIPAVVYSAKLFKNTYNAWANRYWGREIHPIEQFERKYVVKKEYLPKKLQDLLEKEFVLARFDHAKLQEAQQIADLVLHLPMKKFKIHYTEQELESLFKGYPVELKAKMNAFAFRQMMIQSPDKDKPSLDKIRQGKRNAVYFEGVPGTGKTHFAKLTAQALKLPFACISLEGASISDLVGRSPASSDSTPGLILQAITNATVNGKTAKNAILFLDEADRVINNSKSEILPFLLKLLDPETKTFFNPYLGVHIDISNLIIILAGNHSIEDEALAKRLQIIQFKGFPTEYKKQVIWDTTLNKITEAYSQNGKYKISVDDLTEEDKAEINHLIELDQDPGFRTIEAVLMDYIDYKAMKKFNFQLINSPDFQEKILQSNLKYKK